VIANYAEIDESKYAKEGKGCIYPEYWAEVF
jgi:hypothetical protein